MEGKNAAAVRSSGRAALAWHLPEGAAVLPWSESTGKLLNEFLFIYWSVKLLVVENQILGLFL